MAKIDEFLNTAPSICFLKPTALRRLLLMCYGICQSKSVNISRIDQEINSDTSGCKLTAQYKWLMKLFQTGDTMPLIRRVFVLIVGLFYEGEASLSLLIDRTNWEVGKRSINVLTIGLLYKNRIFIPLLHEDLGYKGNSDCDTRIALIEKIIDWWKDLDIPLPNFEIVGDREFIGGKWLRKLEDLKLQYVVRSKANLCFYQYTQQFGMSADKVSAQNLLQDPPNHQHKQCEIVVDDSFVAHLISLPNTAPNAHKEPYIYLITNRKEVQQEKHVYKKRRKIESFFKHLKTAGFHLEDVRLEAPHKINILMAVLALVYAMTIQLAEQTDQPTPNKLQTYRNGTTYQRRSTFLVGRARIVKLKNWDDFLHELTKIVQKSILNLFNLKECQMLKMSG